MTEQEVIEKIARLMEDRFRYPAESVGLIWEKNFNYMLADNILALIKEAGYRLVDLEKLTVLTDKQFDAIIETGFPTNTKPESEGHAHRMIQLAHTKRELGAGK